MTLPLENLDDKTFDDLVRDALSRIPVYAPSWTDYNKSDPGITFIELLAWIVETQIYRLNRISDRSYLKFFRLLGIEGPLPVRPARVDVTFSLQEGSAALPLPAGTEVVATKSGIVFRTQRPLTVLDLEHPDLSNLSVVGQYANKDEAFRLGFKCRALVPVKGDVLSLAIYLKDTPTRPDNDLPYTSKLLSWECLAKGADGIEEWAAMEKTNDETNDLFYTGKIELKLKVDPLCPKDPPPSVVFRAQSPEDMDQDDFLGLIWIRCKILDDSRETCDIPTRIESILANTVSALEGAGYEKEVESSDLPSMTIALEHTPVYNSCGLPPKTVALEPTPVCRIWISVESGKTGTDWKQVEDLDSSGPEDCHFLLDSEKGIISFGDGINGAIPPKDCTIQISYISGAGADGNVPSQAIDRIIKCDASIDPSLLRVENKIAAEGAVPAETLDEAKFRARRTMKEINRAVTLSDYEALAYLTPGVRVARAKAIPCYHPVTGFGTANAVTVIAVPVSSNPKPSPSKMFLRAVFEHLDKHRLLTTRLFVYPPVYVKVNVTANVVARTRWDAANVHKMVRKRLRDFLSPVSGGLEGKGWPFGRSVYLSEIYKIIAATDGVDFVEGVTLEGTIYANEADAKESEADMKDKTGNLRIPEYGLVYLDTESDHQIIVTPREEQSIIRKEVSCE